MQSETFNIQSEEELDSIMEKIYSLGKKEKIWILNGEMGAGKTTFVKRLGYFLNIKDKISSPSFSLVNEYESKNGNTIYHFDFYRINNEAEAFDIGTPEYFDSGNLCLIEWASKISSLIPDSYFEINIFINLHTSRTITVSNINS